MSGPAEQRAVEAMARAREGRFWKDDLEASGRQLAALLAPSTKTCETCEGGGADPSLMGISELHWRPCPSCDGTGTVPDVPLLVQVAIERGVLEQIGYTQHGKAVWEEQTSDSEYPVYRVVVPSERREPNE